MGKPDHPDRHPPEKPKPIISGPSQAEGIARFACRTTYAELTAERRERLKVSLLDALACAINALGAPPIEACRAQAEEFGGRVGRCTLIGGGRGNIIYAAFYNTALIRYVDYMDSYLVGGGLCHPSDNTGAILAASEHADLSGKDFLIALALAYQVESRLTAAVPFMAHGFDLTAPLSFSLAAGVSRTLGLDEAQTAAAVGICGDVIPFACYADHSDLAVEGPILISVGLGVRPRSLLGVPRRNWPYVCHRGTTWPRPGPRTTDPHRLGPRETGLLRPARLEELQHRGSRPIVDFLHA